jgi:hypothetical protein
MNYAQLTFTHLKKAMRIQISTAVTCMLLLMAMATIHTGKNNEQSSYISRYSVSVL